MHSCVSRAVVRVVKDDDEKSEINEAEWFLD